MGCPSFRLDCTLVGALRTMAMSAGAALYNPVGPDHRLLATQRPVTTAQGEAQALVRAGAARACKTHGGAAPAGSVLSLRTARATRREASTFQVWVPRLWCWLCPSWHRLVLIWRAARAGFWSRCGERPLHGARLHFGGALRAMVMSAGAAL